MRNDMFKKSLRAKILTSMFVLVLGLMILSGVIFFFTSKNVSTTLTASNTESNGMIRKMLSTSMATLTEDRLLEMVSGKAELADGIFTDFERTVIVTADAAAKIYDHPETYSYRPVALPDPKNAGKLTAQVLYSSKADPADPEIIEEVGLLGNIQDTIFALNSSQESIASLYFAADSGFIVQVDSISDKKFDDQGNLLPLEAKERPWYIGAATTGERFFTPVTVDLHTPRLAIMCGVPVYHDGILKGVAGAGMYLDDMDVLVQSFSSIVNGQAFIINQDGQILFSTSAEGLLEAKANGQDLRETDYPEFSNLIKKALDGGVDVSLISINDNSYYMAYAPLKTVGWSMIVILPQSEVEQPTEVLMDNLNLVAEDTAQKTNSQIKHAVFLLFTLFGASILVVLVISALLSQQIVKPIQSLTEKVSSIEGNNLDFHWDMDTQDETHLLATSFESMTERMKSYINDIQNITAERERIGTELALARRIQAAMLPSIFPPFPDRSEFDIFALMDPAREVGGDFYDFFLIDDDHLCLVMADVSGKGIPAALFMTISKIILQSRAKMGQSPAKILTETNRAVCANNTEDMFVTLWLGIMDLTTGKIIAANAGHEYPILRDPNGSFAVLKDKHGCAVGAFDDAVYQEYEIQLQPGSRLFLYTDGVPEAKGKAGFSDLFGLDRLVKALNEVPDATPKEILKQVENALADFVKDEEQFDDVTMLCLEYKGKHHDEQ